MNYSLKKFSYLSCCLVMMATATSGAISISAANKAIAQIAQSEATREERLAKAEAVTKAMFDALVAGEFEQTKRYLSPSLKDFLTTAEIEEYWQDVIAKMGNFVEYKKIRPTAVFDNYTVLVSARFESKITDFSVTLDSNQQVTSVDFLWIGDVQENAEQFVDALAQGHYAAARGYLDPKLKKDFLPETLEQEWQDILTEAGSFKSRSDSKKVEGSSSDIVLVNLEFERENRSFMIIFNPLKQIVGVDFPESEE